MTSNGASGYHQHSLQTPLCKPRSVTGGQSHQVDSGPQCLVCSDGENTCLRSASPWPGKMVIPGFEQHVQLYGWFNPWARYLNYEDVNFNWGSKMNAKPMSTSPILIFIYPATLETDCWSLQRLNDMQGSIWQHSAVPWDSLPSFACAAWSHLPDFIHSPFRIGYCILSGLFYLLALRIDLRCSSVSWPSSPTSFPRCLLISFNFQSFPA